MKRSLRDLRVSAVKNFQTVSGLRIGITLIVFCLSWASGASEFPELQREIDRAVHAGKEAIIIIDAHTGSILATNNVEHFTREKFPPGSLIKPFTLISFYRERGDTFPYLECPPTLSSDPAGCWDRNGHGRIGIVRALAHSCNVYFRQLAEQVSPAVFLETLRRFELEFGMISTNTSDEDAVRKLMVGNTNDWAIQPMMILRAYCAIYNGGNLFSNGSRPEARIHIPMPVFEYIRNGMGLSSAEGTSMEARRHAEVPVLGKTGTTLLWNDGQVQWRKTQGWWIGLYPAGNPQIAIMSFVREGRGATDAAPLGGEALRLYLKASKQLR